MIGPRENGLPGPAAALDGPAKQVGKAHGSAVFSAPKRSECLVSMPTVRFYPQNLTELCMGMKWGGDGVLIIL